MIDQKEINRVKAETDLCDTFCCYEDCEACVEKYIKWLDKQSNKKEV